MGNKQLELVKEERTKFRLNDTHCNFALLGFPGAGKSSICNTVHRIITGRSEIVNETVAGTARGTEEVFFLAEVYQSSNIKLFDPPGVNFYEDTWKICVQNLLKGVKLGTSVDDLSKETVVYDVNNKIDYGIIVVNGADPASVQHRWSSPNFVLELRQLIKKETGNEPFVFVTHFNTGGKKQNYYRKLFDVIPEGNVVCFDSYTSVKDDEEPEKEHLLINAFMTMIQRKREKELREFLSNQPQLSHQKTEVSPVMTLARGNGTTATSVGISYMGSNRGNSLSVPTSRPQRLSAGRPAARRGEPEVSLVIPDELLQEDSTTGAVNLIAPYPVNKITSSSLDNAGRSTTDSSPKKLVTSDYSLPRTPIDASPNRTPISLDGTSETPVPVPIGPTNSCPPRDRSPIQYPTPTSVNISPDRTPVAHAADRAATLPAPSLHSLPADTPIEHSTLSAIHMDVFLMRKQQ